MLNGDITTVGPAGLSYFRAAPTVPGMDSVGISFSNPSEITVNSSLNLYFSTTEYSGILYINKQATSTPVPRNSGKIVKVEADLSGFTLPLTLTDIDVLEDRGSSSIAFYTAGIEVDGQVVTDGEPLGPTTLTLASAQDLAYFREGDVVQGVEGSATFTAYHLKKETPDDNGYEFANISQLLELTPGTSFGSMSVETVNTTFDNASYCSSLPNVNATGFVYILDRPRAHIKIGLTTCSGPSTSASFKLHATNDLNQNFRDTPLQIKKTGFNKADPDEGTIDSGSIPYQYFLFYSSDNDPGVVENGIKNYGINNELTSSAPVRIVSIDENVPSITVDGGEWDTSNQSEVWSNQLTSSTGDFYTPGAYANGPLLAFNGDTSSYGTIGGGSSANGDAIWTPSTPMAFNTLKIYYYNGANSGAGLFIDLGSGYGANLIGATGSAGVYELNTPGSITAIKGTSVQTSTFIELRGIEIDGRLLVDAALDSQIWSDNVTVAGTEVAGKDKTKIFDGTDTPAAISAATQYFDIVFNPPIPVNTSLRLKSAISSASVASANFQINNTFVDTLLLNFPVGSNIGNDVLTWTDIPSQFISDDELSHLRVGWSGAWLNIAGIEVDGKLILDKGVRNFGDTKVTFGPVTGTGTFQVADQLNNTMTIQNSNDRWIDNNNRLSKDFYVRDNITVLNADNPKHVAMQQAIADAFAAFPQKVNERRTAIASSFYRLMDGETLTAEEFSILEDTVTNAVNATEPFALNGFYPLYYTEEKANAASDLGTNHSHTINNIEYYMPDGGTLYHGNYIAPQTSTTDNNNSGY